MPRRARSKVPPHLISRTEAMELLGLSRTAVRNREDDDLPPVVIGRNVYYELEAVNRVLFSRSGEACRLAFQSFEEGKKAIAAVIEHNIMPLEAERLWQTYVRLKQKERSTIFIELPENVTREAWRRAHGYPEITGELVRDVLELCARDPRMRRAIQSRLARESA